MSAAVLRAPARWRDAVCAEYVVLASANPLPWLGLYLVLSGLVSSYMREPPYENPRLLAWCMFLLPLAWQGQGESRSDAAVPMGDGPRELARVLCGAACAAVLLGLGLALHAAAYADALRNHGELVAEPAMLPLPGATYPVALWMAGIAHYLVGAAIALRAERPGRVLVAVFFLGWTARSAVAILAGTTHLDLSLEIASLTIPAALLRLTVGAAAVAVAIALGHAEIDRSWARRRGRGALPVAEMGGPPPAAAPIPRLPAPPLRIAARQFAALAPRMAWPLLIVAAWSGRAVLTARARSDGSPPSPTDPFWSLMFVGFLWPVLVWMDERRSHPWDEARPAGTLARRLAHAAAGLAWLQLAALIVAASAVAIAVRFDTFRSPVELPAWLWLGLPLAMAAVYAAGTVFTLPTDHPVLAGIVFGSLLPITLSAVSDGLGWWHRDFRPGPLSAQHLLIPLGWSEPGHWSAAGALLWTLPCVAAGVAAVAWRASRDRRGRDPRLDDAIPLVRRDPVGLRTREAA